MTLSVPFAICPLCHGVHKGIPACLGRPQSDVEWMVDRGVRLERAEEIVTARARLTHGTSHEYPPMAQPPDPRALPGPPYGAPPRVTPAPAPPEPEQESLF